MNDPAGGALVLGVGNEILTDDAVGIVVARKLHDAMVSSGEFPGLSLATAEYGGWRLIDLLSGYDTAVIVDSIHGGPGEPGDCYRVTGQDVRPAHLQSTHGLGLEDAIQVAVLSGIRMPGRIALYAVEAKNVEEFGEDLSPEIETRVPAIVAQIMSDVRECWSDTQAQREVK